MTERGIPDAASLAFQFRDKNTPVFFRTWRDILRSGGVADAVIASVFEPYSAEFLLVRLNKCTKYIAALYAG